MNTSLFSKRSAKTLILFAALGALTTTATALPKAKWDNPGDDGNVLVKGVSMVDYLNGTRAPNGLTRFNLFQGNADYLLTVCEWTFEFSLSPAERAEFQKRLSEAWLAGPRESDAPGVFVVFQHRAPTDEFSPTSFLDRWSRTRTRRAELERLKQFARTDKNGAWILGLYNKYHPALAKGEPRLTRLTTNALTDRLVFMINEVIGKPAAKPTPQLRDRIAKQTAALWPKMSPARRAELLKMETDFQFMQQYGWAHESEAGKEQVRIAWGAELQGAYPSLKPMYLLRKKRLETARRKSAARWAKMSAAEQQMMLMQSQNMMQMNQQMFTSMHNMQVQNHVTNMNIIENMRPTPQFHYSVR